MNANNPVLTHFCAELDDDRRNCQPVRNVPSRQRVAQFADAMFAFLFGTANQQNGSASIRLMDLMAQLTAMAQPLNVDADRAATDFATILPAIHAMLLDDARAALALDPAATSLAEVIATYPGFYAITIYRLAHHLDRVGTPLLPRMLSAYAHSKTGIDIHPAAAIGRSFVIDHGTGIVIGATARIGDHVTLYHGVTLGALRVKKAEANVKRHPTIEDCVTVYANATVLGGKTVIGRGSVLGGNVWVTRSVPAGAHIYYKEGVTRGMESTQHDSASQDTHANLRTMLTKAYQQVVAGLVFQGKRLFLLDDSI